MRTTTPRLVFTLCVLLGINTMNFFDRQVLPAVQEKIRKEWQLSDSELGGLGTAFILLYAVVGLPLGRLALLRPFRHSLPCRSASDLAVRAGAFRVARGTVDPLAFDPRRVAPFRPGANVVGTIS